MTFCLVFCAKNRGGVGIVSDRRISIETEFDGWVPVRDDATKFGLINNAMGVAAAGSVYTIQLVLNRLAEFPVARRPSERLNEMTGIISKIYDELIAAHHRLRDPDAHAIFIFFDTYRRHSSQRFRLHQIQVRYNQLTGKGIIELNFDRGKDWVAIGASPRIRQQLAGCALEDMQEFARSKISFRRSTKQEIEKIPPAKRGSPEAAIFRQEPGINPPWRELETYRMLKEFGDASMDYAAQLTQVASNAIHYEVMHLKGLGLEEMQTISQVQHTAVFHPAYGLRVSTPGFPDL